MLVAVGFGIRGVGIGSGLIDPFFKFGAGDEVVYGHAASRMVSTGHWATSVFLGRLLLNKPPLLMWMGAASMRLLGVSTWTLRIPVVLAGGLCCGLVYLWMRRLGQPIAAALTAMLLVAGDPIFHVMARKFMTDIVLTLWVTLSAFVLGCDLRLKKTWSPYLYGALSGAAIMTKSAAGFIPLMILAVYWLVAAKSERPAFQRLLIAGGSALVVAAPWHIYEFATHRNWFLTEYLNVQLVGMGITGPAATGGGPRLWFYLREILLADPVLALLSLAAVPGAVVAWKREDEPLARLLIAWIAVVLVCLAAFANRASYYALPLIPALALFSARFAPGLRGRRTAWLGSVVLLVLFCVKAGVPDQIWGLDFRQGTTLRSASELDTYNRLKRANELVIVSPDEQLYASVIDLPKIRYAWISPSVDYSTTPEFFYRLGIIVTAPEFCRPVDAPLHVQRLKEWRAPDASSLAQVIMARSNEGIADIIRCSPERDFFLPDAMQPLGLEAGLPAHKLVRFGPDGFFLLAVDSVVRRPGPPMPGTLVTRQ